MLTIEQIRNIVADALVKVGHGNPLFIDSIRRGEQDDGPFMTGALAVQTALEDGRCDAAAA